MTDHGLFFEPLTEHQKHFLKKTPGGPEGCHPPDPIVPMPVTEDTMASGTL